MHLFYRSYQVVTLIVVSLMMAYLIMTFNCKLFASSNPMIYSSSIRVVMIM